MKIDDTEIIDHESSIATNDRWVNELHRLYRNAADIVVQHHETPEDRSRGFKKFQRIQLTRRPKSDYPRESFDEIIDCIAASCWGFMHGRLEQGLIEEDEPVHFSVEVRQISGERQLSRKRVFFCESLAGNPDDPYDDPETTMISELERRQQQHLETLLRTVEHQSMHIERLQETLLETAKVASAPMAAVAKLTEHAGGMMVAGMNQQLIAAKMQFDDRKADSEQREQTKRQEMWMESVGQHLLPKLPTILAALANKFGAGIPVPPASGPPGSEPQNEQEIRDQYFAAHIIEFSSSLTDEQWRGIDSALRPAEMAAFKRLLEAETEAQTYERIEALQAVVDDFGAVMSELQNVLTETQLAAIVGLYGEYSNRQ